MSLISLQNVSLHARIKNVNLEIEQGQYWHLLGPNGAGKSSLLDILSGIQLPSNGIAKLNNINIGEHSLATLATTRCFLHQQQHSQFDIPLAQLLQFYAPSVKLPAILDEHLNITPLLNKPLVALSGGQQQRFHIARNLCQIWPAIIKGEALVLLDEPISHLDVKYQYATMCLLKELNAKGNTVVMTSHDINISHQFAGFVGLLQKQALIFQGLAPEVMTLSNLGFIFEHEFQYITGAPSNTNRSAQAPQKYIVSASQQSI